MNIFFRELKFYSKSLVFWSVGMLALIFSSMVKYSAFQSSGSSINDLVAQFPQSVQTILGLNGFDITQAIGFFGMLFMYLALMITIHAVLLGAGIISKEERDKTSEFLLTKPISRVKIITSKIAAGLVSLVIINLVTLGASIYFIEYFEHNNADTKNIFILIVGLFIMQLIFFFIGTAVAAISKKPKSATSIATAGLLTTFIMTFLVNINHSFDNLKYLTPFKYFDAKDILASQNLDLVYVLISIIIIAALITSTYIFYKKRDMK